MAIATLATIPPQPGEPVEQWIMTYLELYK